MFKAEKQDSPNVLCYTINRETYGTSLTVVNTAIMNIFKLKQLENAKEIFRELLT